MSDSSSIRSYIFYANKIVLSQGAPSPVPRYFTEFYQRCAVHIGLFTHNFSSEALNNSNHLWRLRDIQTPFCSTPPTNQSLPRVDRDSSTSRRHLPTIAITTTTKTTTKMATRIISLLNTRDIECSHLTTIGIVSWQLHLPTSSQLRTHSVTIVERPV